MGERVAVFPAGRQDLYTQYQYSAAVRSEPYLFVSGQVGSRPDGSVEPDLDEQLRLAFQNLEAVLSAGGCGFGDIVDITLFIVDPEASLPVFLRVRDAFWGPAPYPTLTAVGVTWLSGFAFELKVVARLPDMRQSEEPTDG